MKWLGGLGRGLVLLVVVFLLLPSVYQLLQVFMPLIFMLLGLVLVVKIFLGKVGKW